MLNKVYKFIAAAALSALCLSGCGGASDKTEKALAEFSASVSEFSDYIKIAGDRINALDVSRIESETELLEILDEMDEKFAAFAQVEVPIQYSAVDSLADEASQNMSQAVAFYHSAYEGEGGFDKNIADAAYEYYTRAMVRITYIGYVLAGDEIPESDNVTIYEESNDESILDRWLSDGDDETAPEAAAPEAAQ